MSTKFLLKVSSCSFLITLFLLLEISYMDNPFADSTDENEVKDEQDTGYSQYAEEEPQLISDAVKQFETDQSGQQR